MPHAAPSAPSVRPVKMSTLARLSGVPAATIKHYLREGLLPKTGMKPFKNSALYDPRLAERIKRIKTLQREHFLPLKVIRGVLAGAPSEEDDAETAEAIRRALAAMEGTDVRTRAQVVASGAREDDLALFEALGLVTPVDVDGEPAYTGQDLELLRLLAAARRVGITPDMLPASIVQPYVRAIRDLVRVELRMFREGVVPRAGANLAEITEAATRMSEQLVVLIRRKMLLPTLAGLVRALDGDEESANEESANETSGAPTPRPPGAPARRAPRVRRAKERR